MQQVCQIPVDRTSIRILLPLLRTFSRSSGLYKVVRSPYFSLEKPLCENNNLHQQHARNDVFIRRLVHGKRYTDIYTSTVSDQY